MSNHIKATDVFAAHAVALPQHIAIIMDGNGRWAKQRHLPRIAGHKAGVDAVRAVVRGCVQHNIKVLTLFAFSNENWSRPPTEVNALMQLFISALKREISQLHKNNIQLRFIGDLNRLNAELQQAIENAATLTANNSGLILVIAVDYGGQWDIVQAARQLAMRVNQGELTITEIDAQQVQQALSTGDLPPPDLFIRTSGEQRISNFLLWQLAYTELYFTDIFWPDFDEKALQQALNFYAARDRRFGGLSPDASAGFAHA